jgi:hypothetical protein
MTRAAFSLIALLAAGSVAEAQSAAARKAAKEVVEFLRTRFARELAEEGAERVEGRLARAIERWGDDAAAAVRRTGPRIALAEVERHGAPAARILARWGDDGARLLATEGNDAVKVLASLGDEGVELMIRRHGTRMAAQLPDLAPQIAASGRSREVLGVLERFGDRASAFIWRNKGTIFGATVLAAFLANPEPFINGTQKLLEVPVGQMAARTDWTAVWIVAMILVAGMAGIRLLFTRRVRTVANSPARE